MGRYSAREDFDLFDLKIGKTTFADLTFNHEIDSFQTDHNDQQETTIYCSEMPLSQGFRTVYLIFKKQHLESLTMIMPGSQYQACLDYLLHRCRLLHIFNHNLSCQIANFKNGKNKIVLTKADKEGLLLLDYF